VGKFEHCWSQGGEMVIGFQSAMADKLLDVEGLPNYSTREVDFLLDKFTNNPEVTLAEMTDAYFRRFSGHSTEPVRRGSRSSISKMLQALRTVHKETQRTDSELGDIEGDKSEPWSFLDDHLDEDARIVLDCLAEVTERTESRRWHITKEEARMIVKVRRVAPNLSTWVVYKTAREYLHRRYTGDDTQDLDMLLASGGDTPESPGAQRLRRIETKLDALSRHVQGLDPLTIRERIEADTNRDRHIHRQQDRYARLMPLVDVPPTHLLYGLLDGPELSELEEQLSPAALDKQAEQTLDAQAEQTLDAQAEQTLDAVLQQLNTQGGTQAAEQRLEAALEKLNTLGSTPEVVKELDAALGGLPENELEDQPALEEAKND
jgi:hypothetical protein